MKSIRLNLRIVFIILFIVFMIFALIMMYSGGSELAYNGKVDLSSAYFKQNELVPLDGNWEFYWDRLLTTENFASEPAPQMDSFMEVPGDWSNRESGSKVYPHYGIATYRLRLNYPSTIKDPALRIKRIASAFKIYANGRLIEQVGNLRDKPSNLQQSCKLLIVDLPKDKQQVEIVFQVANLDYARGGLRESPVFGSKKVLEEQKMILFALQLLFIGSVSIFGIYYLLIFILERKSKTALLFIILCFVTALRSLVWGELPLINFFPKVPIKVGVYINYITGYNLMPIIILVIISIYPLEYKKTIVGLILMPNIFFEVLLLTPAKFMASFNKYFYVLMVLQIIYILGVLIKAVICRRDNAILVFISMGIFVLSIIEEMFHYKGIGSSNISYVYLCGNFALIMAMAFVQAGKQASIYKKLILYNKNLIEADRLRDKIMATEMSFLQAQIKPHFLYNAMSAIANVCEKDGKKAGNLIVDLAIYLRGSLEFNRLDKMVTIEKELEFISRYFNIEQARFGQKIQLLKEIEVSLDYKIPVLILQPLVENAVRHGISKKQVGGRVMVRMMKRTEGIIIEIEDDGIGIEGEKLDFLLSEKRKNQGVGLFNIHHRLLRLYGRGLDISSEMGRGTCVRFMMLEGREEL
ncbi:sensor histidine kinase [Clostridium tagluense]|uniref:Histidine kinase n=1 Tax=Clostridium tagluense TaxID=360422 RepID=A0A401UHI6_9CLOT|nr:histidine kinase [Clostridium tagluense]GCD09018.1 histidine kinase [Clostridium tagluense]